MIGRVSTVIALAAVSLLLAAGCSRPASTELFIKVQDAVDGVYGFEFPMDDAAGSYDISFYTRIDSPSRSSVTEALKLEVRWRSPSGEYAGETVYMDASKLEEKYRSGVSPKETGNWRIEVRVPAPPKGFRGLGIVCEYNGTR